MKITCRSLAGFQLLSNITTRLAATKLIPMLPAFVDIKNNLKFLPDWLWLNLLINLCLSSVDVFPVMRQKFLFITHLENVNPSILQSGTPTDAPHWGWFRHISIKLNVGTDWENKTTLSPSFTDKASNARNATILFPRNNMSPCVRGSVFACLSASRHQSWGTWNKRYMRWIGKQEKIEGREEKDRVGWWEY